MATQGNIGVVKGILYNYRDVRIVKGGKLYPLADAGVVKSGVLYNPMATRTGRSASTYNLRSSVEKYDLQVSVIKTDTETGDAVSLDIAVGTGDTWVNVPGYDNLDRYDLVQIPLSEGVAFSVKNIGTQPFKVVGAQLLQNEAVLADITGFKGGYNPEDQRDILVNTSLCVPGTVVLKIYIQNI